MNGFGQTFSLTPDSLYEVISKRKVYFEGFYSSYTDSVVTFILVDGQTKTIKLKNIWQISSASKKQIRKGRFWPENQFSNRTLLLPSAYGLKRKQIQYQNFALGMNQLSIGLSDHVAVNVGLFPGLLWASVKFSYPIVENRLAIGAGVLTAAFAQMGSPTPLFYHACLTIGSRENHLTVGYIGSNQGKSDVVYSRSIQVSGLMRIHRKAHGFFEFARFNDHEKKTPIGVAGVRTGRKDKKVEFGLVYLPQSKLVLPWFGFAYSFSRVRPGTILFSK